MLVTNSLLYKTMLFYKSKETNVNTYRIKINKAFERFNVRN